MKYTFKELADVPKLQELTDELYIAASIPSAIIAMDGEILTASGWQKICTDFHRKHPQIEKECIKSDSKIRTKLGEGETFAIYRCPRGLVDASSPVIIAGEHVANVFSGQVFLEPPDETTKQFFREQARKFGFDETEYMKAFKKVPIFTEKKFRAGISFLAKLAQSIADTGITRLRELEGMEVLKKTQRLLTDTEKMGKVGGWEFNIHTEKTTWTEEIYNIYEVDLTYDPTMRKGLNFYTPDSRPIIEQAVQRAMEHGEPFDVELEIITGKGNLRIVHAVGKADLEHDRVYGFFQNVTDRKQAETDLQISELKYKNQAKFLDVVIENSPFAMQVMDAKGVIMRVNQALRDYLNITDDMVVGKYNILHDENLDNQALMPLVESVFNDLKSARYILFWTGAKAGDVDLSIADKHWIDAALFPITDEAGKLVNVVGQYIDITEHKRDEKKLKDNERFLQTLIDAIPVPVFYKDREGKYLGFNRTFKTFFGEPNEQMIGKTVFDINPPELAKTYHARDQELFKSGGVQRYEAQWQDVHGTVRDFILNKAVFCDSKGSTIGLIGVLTDITERKQVEEEKERLQSQLQQAQKMEAVGTLAGGIAHDFNNILAIILGNAELASDEVPDSNPASDSLKEIYDASIRARDMVKQLLAFSRKADEETKPIDMAPIIQESMKMLRSAIPTSVMFKERISDDPCSVMGDAAQINQIVMNLVTNAADAMSEEGGLLEVTLEKIILQEKKPCFDWVLSPGAYVRLRMRDTGGGIEPTTMKRIFDPYYTTKEVGKGTGMGLSVVHGIVKSYGGGIRAESELKKGTRFEIYFPALEKRVAEEEKPEGEIKGGYESILFVDDEESIVNLNRQRLERLGYQIKSTTKPLEVLEWFKADPDAFDVIITDMTMPRMTGDKLAAEILKIRPYMPVIICTGYSERMSARKAETLGLSKYIEKPMDLRNLASALREVLDGK